MALGKDVLSLQDKIGYRFFDVSYLDTALTHTSYTNEQRQRGIKATSNERLEFLGDAVLEMVISEYLYANFKKYREGALTKMRQQLVCERTLAKLAVTLSVGEYINLGNGEEHTDCRRRPKILADALEALIAAVYLDCTDRGTEDYKKVILNIFRDEFSLVAASATTDSKTMLQQLAEKDGSALLEYRVVKEEGPEHNKLFTVVAYVNNNEVGRGVSGTKKDAEMEAARVALSLFGVNI